MGATLLTKQGLAKLQTEQKDLFRQKHRLTEEVHQAAAMGDLRENAEYHAARERLQHVSQRLMELEVKLSNVSLVENLVIKAGEARIGALVTLQDEETKDRVAYLLVGPDEADPQDGKLSIASPLGKSLLGKKKGERFTLTLPKANVPYKIMKIERP